MAQQGGESGRKEASLQTGGLRGGKLQRLQQRFLNFLICTCLVSKKYLQVHYSVYKFIFCVLLYSDVKVLCTF